MLTLHTSNYLEVLGQRLAEILQRPLRSPFERETIVVQSQGMARWLKLELAARHGICANYVFPFPRVFCAQVLAAASGQPGGLPTQEREVMRWAIMRLLPETLSRPEFSALRAYLSDSGDNRRRFQLSAQIANLFDQYMVFRPDVVLAWDEGRVSGTAPEESDDEAWQAELWRRLCEEKPGLHPAALLSEFQQRAAKPDFKAQAAPARLCVFGISALPPSYLELFCALGARAELHLFLLQPSPEYWGLIANARETERILKAAGKGDAAAGELHLEAGNRLLASLGSLGRDFLNLILDAADWEEDLAFAEPRAANLLQHIQADIYHLRDRGHGDRPKPTISATDSSLRVHSCHSPLREVEVLYDHMLEWFERDPALAPRDVLVMTPDIDTYAPFVQAVFDSPEEASKRIPFSVADRGPSASSPVAGAFLGLLNLPTTRLEATAVLRILETGPVREKFGLAEPDLDTIRAWVRGTNIRWGQDARQRESLGLPGLVENTWQQGLDRLFAGYALAGDGEQMFGGVLPFEGVEGGAAEALGHLAEYLKQVFELVARLRQPRPVTEWEGVLLNVLDTFFEPDDTQLPEMLLLRSTLRELAAQAAEAGCAEPVDLAVILEALGEALAKDRAGAGFLTGGVTFCALKPMRSIPFKVIALIGMNDGAFPRADRHLSFDLIAKKPRLGDRSLRADDRYLFLETLLSARERLHISYVGQSIRDNSEAPPSVLVSELLDYVAQGYQVPGGGILKAHVLVRHPLQAFSPAYFTGQDARLFSYSAENCQASQCGQAARAEPRSFIAAPLREPEPDWRTIEVAELAEFFRNPARWLLTRRLGLRFEEQDEALEEVEPFAVAPLDGYAIRQELVALSLKRLSSEDGLRMMRAAGRLPLGEAGAVCFRGLQAEVQAFLEQLEPRLGAGYLDPLPVDHKLGQFRLTGEIRRLTVNGSLHYRCASIKAKDLLRLWIPHVALNAAHPGGPCSQAVLVGSDKVLAFPPLAQAPVILAGLLELYWQGLTAPLKFFPQTSWAYAETARANEAGESKRDASSAARLSWEGNTFTHAPGEGADAYFDLCFRNADPLDEEFQQTARAVFEPLLRAMQEVET